MTAQNMATPMAAATRAPNHPALTVPALLEAEGLRLVLAVVEAAAEDFDVVVAVTPVLGDAGAAVAPARGAVDCPSIWAWMTGLKVPPMLFKLQQNFN